MQGLKRDAEDYEIPGDAESHEEHGHDEHDHGDEHEHEEEPHDEEAHEHHDEHGGDTLESSFVENEFYSAGASWFFNERNYLGASISRYESHYGVPGHSHDHGDDHDHEGEHDEEPHDEEEHEHGEHEGGVAIEMERTRFDLELAVFEPTDWIEALRVRFGYTDYEHIEAHAEEGEHHHGHDDEEAHGDEAHGHDEHADAEHEHEEGTLFEREGWELRADIAHYDWAIFTEGIFGIQISDTDFQATGEELEGEGEDSFGFGPPSTTRNQAFFFSEHIHSGDLHFDFGGRIERQTIDAEGENTYRDVAFSLALGAIWELNEANSLALSFQRTERHPNATELYAEGPHLATNQYQVGDPDLGIETAYGVDLSYRHRSENWEGTVSVFYTYFEDFIFDQRQGEDEEGGLPLYNYVAVDALFYGFEAGLDYIAYRSADTTLRLGILADYVVAENRDNGEDLPRIPPFRLGGKVELAHGNWNAGLLLRHSFDQNDTAPTETDTDGFTELQAELGYIFEINNRADLTLFARANNLLDEEIRHHTSFVKDQAPRPGRNLTLGARVEF